MTSDRPYRAALSLESARSELLANAGTQFDPRVVQALVAVVEMEQAEPPASCPLQLTIPTGAIATNVLDSELPRQTPAWKSREAAPSASAFGEVRAICRSCGSHVAAVVTTASLSGSCGNCGSYELDLRG